MKDFGIIIVCSKDDFVFAKGCAASSKYFMSQVPLGILVDGDLDPDETRKRFRFENGIL